MTGIYKIADKTIEIVSLHKGVHTLCKDYICEVNSNAFFKEIEDISNANVAKAYAKHIFKVVYDK